MQASRNARKIISTLAAIFFCHGAMAQDSGVTLYGTIDEYINRLHSSSGTHFTSLEEGGLLRSRFGFRGVEQLGGGYSAKFQLEAGYNGDTGAQGDATRAFDRQSWVGLAGPAGEIRLGRQNGPAFNRGYYIDYTARSMGSIVNAFGLPIRFDNDISYLSPRIYGVMAEAHISLPETVNSATRQAVYQVGLDYINDFMRLGYAGMRAAPPVGALYQRDVSYDNVFANWMYGKGTVYMTYVRSNNITSTTAGNNTGAILNNVGGLLAGTNPDINNFYNVWQISADYQVSAALRIGALWGWIDDKSGNGRNANGGSVGAYYDLSKRTTVYALADTLRNSANAGFRPQGSANLKTTFTTASDVNGRIINGVQLGILHRF